VKVFEEASEMGYPLFDRYLLDWGQGRRLQIIAFAPRRKQAELRSDSGTFVSFYDMI
jgi:hypothetical protein